MTRVEKNVNDSQLKNKRVKKKKKKTIGSNKQRDTLVSLGRSQNRVDTGIGVSPVILRVGWHWSQQGVFDDIEAFFDLIYHLSNGDTEFEGDRFE